MPCRDGFMVVIIVVVDMKHRTTTLLVVVMATWLQQRIRQRVHLIHRWGDGGVVLRQSHLNLRHGGIKPWPRAPVQRVPFSGIGGHVEGEWRVVHHNVGDGAVTHGPPMSSKGGGAVRATLDTFG